MPGWHRLLQRQLKKYFGQSEPPAEVRVFADAVDRAYHEFDEDRRMLERSLELSSNELLQANTDMRMMFEAFPDVLYRIDLDGKVLDCRVGRAGGGDRPQERPVGSRVQDIFAESAKEEFEKVLRQMRQTSSFVATIEYSLTTDAKHLHFYEARLRRLNESQIVVVIRDITERKKLEGRLIQSQKLDTVGTLAGGIAHDLNNQLTPLVGYLSLLLQMVEPGDEKRQFLEEADLAAQRCKDVVSRLLNFSRPSTQKKKVISLGTILEELKKFLPKFLPATIKTEIAYARDLWPVAGNETELETVVMNLAANSRDAMPNGGVLEIRVENVELDAQMIREGFDPGKYVLIAVKDTGEGMPEATVKRIFEPFFTTKERGRGTGLGLSMAFNIVKDHKGWIEVTSEPARGTAFEIYLPVAADPKALETAPSSGGALPRGNETLLLADDEESIRVHGKLLLERLGYRVVLAGDGEEALRIYTENRKKFQAVILDVLMPKMPGNEALVKILELDPAARVILSSGYSENNAGDFIKKGARDFVQKPYTAMALAQSVRKCLDQ